MDTIHKHFGVPATEDHSVSLRNISGYNGEPAEYAGSCSCGWEAITVVDDQGVTIDLFIPELKEIGRAYGIGELYKGAVLGSKATAVVQILAHLNYEPQWDLETAEGAYQTLTHELRYTRPSSELKELGEAFLSATKELIEARVRAETWHSTELPVAPTLNPTVQKLIALSVPPKCNNLTPEEQSFKIEEFEKVRQINESNV